MGTSSWNLEILGRLFDEGHFRMPAAICDIGCAQLGQEPDDIVRAFPQRFGRDSGTREFKMHSFMGDLYTDAGFAYVSLDVLDAPYVRRFDLNCDPVPQELRGKFDLVLNFGTSEHVLNQLNAFQAIHDLMKPGGVSYSMFLLNGFGDHGLVRYSSKFVDTLARANAYDVVFREVHRGPQGSIDECEWVVFKKTADKPFVVPFDT